MTPEQVMKACQVGCHNLNAANDLLAQCYGTIGKLLIDLQAARAEPEQPANKESLTVAEPISQWISVVSGCLKKEAQ